MADRDSLREAKENLLTRGLLAEPSYPRGAMPESIERSWRRSISQGVSPHRAPADPVDAEFDQRVLSAARPVLSRLAEQVADMCVGVVLSDADGMIIERFVSDRSQRAQLDRAGALVGSDFAESAVGTNGLGSVIEERAPMFVRGAEHFIDALEEVACAGVPIFDPGTRRVRGSLSLTCRAKVANPLMLTLAHAAVRDIEQRLMDGRSRGLMDIAAAFAEATRRSDGALALLTPRTVLANTAGLPYVSPANHAAIWDRLVADEIERPALLRVDLTDGPVTLRAQRVHVADERLAFQVAFAPDAERGAKKASGPRWHPLRSVHDELVSLARTRSVLALAGERGTGKTSSARRALESFGDSYREIDVPQDGKEDASSWVAAVADARTSGSRVLLRYVERLPEADLPKLHDVLAGSADPESSACGSARLVLTVERSAASEHLLEIVEGHAGVVELPALAEMRSTIPQIVQAMILERSRAERCMFSAAAMQALSDREWPGNIAELRRVVSELSAKHPGRMVSRPDLPESFQAGGRVLTPMERSERATIVRALREADGNRAAAARILGIGRTTLYRKLRSLRIAGDELTA